MRDALSLTDQVLSMAEGKVTAERVRDALGLVPEDEFIAMLDLIADRRAADVFPAVARLAEAGVDFGQFLTGLADILRAQLAIVLGGTSTDVSERAREALESRKDRLAAADLLRMLQAVGELEPRFRKSGQQQLLIETLIVRFALLDHAVDLEDVLRSIGSGDSGGGGGPIPFVRPEPRPVPRAEASGNSAAGSAARATGPSAPAPSPMGDWRSTIQGFDGQGAPAPAPSPVVRRSSPAAPSSSAGSADVTAVTGRWDDLIERFRAGGKPMLASALGHASPAAVTASGVLTVELDEPNDIFAHSINQAKAELLGALREWFPSIERLELKRDDSAPAKPPVRLTDEMIRADRVASLRKKDPVLNAAIEALDLDVAD